MNRPADVPNFEKERANYAKLLGYEGKTKSSSEAQRMIERKCTDQIRKLHGKSSLIQSDETPTTTFNPSRKKISEKLTSFMEELLPGHQKELTDQEKKDIINASMLISQLYRDSTFKAKVTGMDTIELNLKNRYTTLESVKMLFGLKFLGETEYYSQNGVALLHKIRGFKTSADLKRHVLEEIDAFNRSKRAKVLSMDSNIEVLKASTDVKTTLENYFNDARKKPMLYYLPLKDGQFSITFSDRPIGAAFSRGSFTVERELDLTDFIEGNPSNRKEKILKIFVKGNELKKGSYKFDLMSATIGTGGHYYLYKRGANNNEWVLIDDDKKRTCRWDKVGYTPKGVSISPSADISQRCETLTYKLNKIKK